MLNLPPLPHALQISKLLTIISTDFPLEFLFDCPSKEILIWPNKQATQV